MTPYYEHGGITIYHGDCRKVLPRLSTVDLVVTDPPYGKAYHSGGIAGKPSHKWKSPRDKWRGESIVGDRFVDTSSVPLLVVLLRDGGAAYVFSQWMTEHDWRHALDASGLRVRNRLVWAKPFHGAGDLKTTFGPQHESILYASRGRHELSGPRDGDVWYEPVGSNGCFRKGLQHPNQKPTDLIEWLICKSSSKGDLVLDPFCGSGTTLVAAYRKDRRAIGIEIEERYCEIAAKRLAKEVLPLEMGA